MDPRPHPSELYTGGYYRTKGGKTRTRCKAYRTPPSHRLLGPPAILHEICTIKRGAYLGPVEEFEITSEFVTILVRGYWINVWGYAEEDPELLIGHHYAYPVPWQEVRRWYRRGWKDHINVAHFQRYREL